MVLEQRSLEAARQKTGQKKMSLRRGLPKGSQVITKSGRTAFLRAWIGSGSIIVCDHKGPRVEKSKDCQEIA